MGNFRIVPNKSKRSSIFDSMASVHLPLTPNIQNNLKSILEQIVQFKRVPSITDPLIFY